jgi:kynureninase
MNYEFTEAYADKLDKEDEISHFRNSYHIPQFGGEDMRYFTGNSLGLQPKNVRELVNEELDAWEKYGVEGHFEGKRPWFHYHKFTKGMMARLVGAQASEVVVMNSLTTNLHLLMVTFYRPTKSRYKIIAESGAFPSDQYVFESQVRFHGFDPDEAIIELEPREGEDTLRTDDILQVIKKQGDEVALVMMSGVQYFTGQFFDMAAITSAGHEVGAKVGFDLAHAIGNVPLQLHDWNVDFAVWCTYKYLNSGPGSTAGAYIHQRYGNDPGLPRFAGWWGYNEQQRFMMQKGFVPMLGADGWQLSNVNVLPSAAILGALEIFHKVDFKKLRRKSQLLTGYAEFLINAVIEKTAVDAKIITPTSPEERGCQLSLALRESGKDIYHHLMEHGVMVDWRESNMLNDQPAIIRLAPVPMYNTFRDVHEFAVVLEEALMDGDEE